MRVSRNIVAVESRRAFLSGNLADRLAAREQPDLQAAADWLLQQQQQAPQGRVALPTLDMARVFG